MISKDYMVSLDSKILGIHARLKELHYSAPNMDIHKLTDEFIGELLEFEDKVMENLQPMPGIGFVSVGDLHPEVPEEANFMDVLTSVRGMVADLKKQAGDAVMYSGIVSIVDDFFATINKYIYLVKIVEK